MNWHSRAADVRRIHAKGKKVALMGVENGYPLGEDIGSRERILRSRRALHRRSLTTATISSPIRTPASATAGSGNGVSPLGKQVVGEMNRLGIMVDVSRTRRKIRCCKPPHCPRRRSSHPTPPPARSAMSAVIWTTNNLLALKESGGVIQICRLQRLHQDDRAGLGRAQRGSRGRREMNITSPIRTRTRPTRAVRKPP